MAALWALTLGVVLYQKIKFQTIREILRESSGQTATTMLLIASAFILNYAITNEKLAESLVATISAMDLSPLQFMLVVNVFFLSLDVFSMDR